MPDWLEPMAATLTQNRFAGGDWLFERKFDGIRLVAYKNGADVRLLSRNRLAQHLPELAKAMANVPVDEVILDGEVTWDSGNSYHVFDIMWLNGRAVTSLPLEDRRRLLQSLPLDVPMRRVDLFDDEKPWERASREGWEGVIAKRRARRTNIAGRWTCITPTSASSISIRRKIDPEECARQGLDRSEQQA